MYPVPGCVVERVVADGTHGTILRVRAAGDEARCPGCHTVSRAPHSTYYRRPADLPSLGRRVRLELVVRRFYCGDSACARRTFAERLPGLLDGRARRTRRLAAAQRAVAVEVGAEAGARLTTHLAMPVSADTLLRLVRRVPLPALATPRTLGVDDWALKKGRTYGTILVDLDARRVVDLLPDRTGTTLARWLRRCPGVEVVTRDRSTEYTRAITATLPEAVQVADRWHLLLNARQMLERWVATIGGRLRHLPAPADARAAPTVARTAAFPRSPTEVRAGVVARDRWRALYDDVRRRHAAGEPLMRIARTLGLARGTVRRFAASATLPETGARPIAASSLDPFLAYLSARHEEGCENGLQLWRELQARGYTGHSRQIHRWLQARRRVPAPTQSKASRRAAAEQLAARAAAPPRLPSPRQLAWLGTLLPHERSSDGAATIARITQDTEVAQVLALTQRFVALVRERPAPEAATATLAAWLKEAGRCGVRAVETFAAGLVQDGDAVQAALTTPWSNAQTEGHVTKLKLLKRQMYGRANFDLLRRRVLLAA